MKTPAKTADNFPSRLAQEFDLKPSSDSKFMEIARELESIFTGHLTAQHRTAQLCFELAEISDLGIRELSKRVQRVYKEISPSWFARLARAGEFLEQRPEFKDIKDIDKILVLSRLPEAARNADTLTPDGVLKLPNGLGEVNIRQQTRKELVKSARAFNPKLPAGHLTMSEQGPGPTESVLSELRRLRNRIEDLTAREKSNGDTRLIADSLSQAVEYLNLATEELQDQLQQNRVASVTPSEPLLPFMN